MIFTSIFLTLPFLQGNVLQSDALVTSSLMEVSDQHQSDVRSARNQYGVRSIDVS